MLDPHHLNYRVIVLWALSLLVGAVGFFFLVIVPLAFASLNTGWFLLLVVSTIGVLGGAITGLLTGIIQGVVLTKRVPWAKRWLRGSILSWAAGGAVWCLVIGLLQLAFFEYPKQGVDENIGILLGPAAAALAGTVIGAIQSMHIGGRGATTRYWIKATTVGWISGGLTWIVLAYLVPPLRNQQIYYMLFIPVIVGIAGLVTGYSMNVLLSWGEGNP